MDFLHWLIVAAVVAAIIWKRRSPAKGAGDAMIYRQVAVLTNTSGEYWLGLVGESNYRENIRAGLPASYRPGHECHVSLISEPDNPYDPNAIAAFLGKLKVGYLSREHARTVSAQFTANGWHNVCVRVPAIVHGGTPSKPDFGIWLDMPR